MAKRKFHEVVYFREDSDEDNETVPPVDYDVDLIEYLRIWELGRQKENYQQPGAVTSLQNICLSSICSMVWMKTDVRQSIITLYRKERHYVELFNEWNDIENDVQDKIAKLVFPKRIIQSLSIKASYMRYQIVNWMDMYFDPSFDIWKIPKYTSACLIKYLSWTVRGTIDHAKTAQKIINESLLNDHYKYRLACIYSLQEEIFTMASRIVNIRFLSRLNREMSPAIYIWTILFICCDYELYDKYRFYMNLDDSRSRQFRKMLQELKNIVF